jgi:hypothetical protein
MDEPLEIPTATICAAARAAYVDLKIYSAAPIEAALNAAAPLIVAAELRRQADELNDRRHAYLRSEGNRSIRSSGLELAIYQLHTRANELDPQ